jgi:hypothetical protein
MKNINCKYFGEISFDSYSSNGINKTPRIFGRNAVLRRLLMLYATIKRNALL